LCFELNFKNLASNANSTNLEENACELPYILESMECNMCERQNKNRDAYDKICTKQREVH
jgi:hypothetical protein